MLRRAIIGGDVRARGFHDPASRNLEFRNLAAGVEGAVGQAIGTANTWPVIRDEDRVRTNSFHDHSGKREAVAAGLYRYPISVADFVLLRQPGMDFHSRPGILIDESADPAGLGARQVLAYDAAGGEVYRVLFIHWIA